MTKKSNAKITLFHCINAYTEDSSVTSSDYDLNVIKMPCSGMTTEVFILKAFESGADAVVIMVCPLNTCRYMEGNLRAEKRVTWTKKVLDEIGVDGKRLSLHNVKSGDSDSVNEIIKETLSVIDELGPNPAA